MINLTKRYFFPLILVLFLLYSAIVIYKTSFIVHGVRYFSLSDDLMTGMKFAYNLAHGHGWVFSLNGQHVEGFTNPLWVLYMTLFHLFPIPIEKISLAIQISAAVFMAGALYFV